MKALCYTTKLASGLYATSNPELAVSLAKISKQISGARATLRLVDDIPMLQYTLEYGLGSKVGIIKNKFGTISTNINRIKLTLFILLFFRYARTRN